MRRLLLASLVFAMMATTTMASAASAEPGLAAPTVGIYQGPGGDITLTWDSVTGAAGYNIYRDGGNSEANGYLTTVSGGNNTRFDDPENARVGWSYYVIAYDGNNGFSSRSNRVTVTRQSNPITPLPVGSPYASPCRTLTSFVTGCHSSGGPWTPAFSQFAPQIGVAAGSAVGARVKYFPAANSPDPLDQVVYMVGPYIGATNELEDDDSIEAELRTVRSLAPVVEQIERTLANADVSIVYIGFGNLEDSQSSTSQRVVATKSVIRSFEAIRRADAVPGNSALLGISLGGVVGKIALRELEDERFQHGVTTYISFDSPHWGAYTPLGLQYVPIFLRGAFDWADGAFFGLARDIGDAADEAAQATRLSLTSPVGQDLLMRNLAYPDGRPPNLGYIQSRYRQLPQQTSQNIAIASGSIDGTLPNLADAFFTFNTGKSGNEFKPMLELDVRVPSIENNKHFYGRLSHLAFSGFEFKRVPYTRNRTVSSGLINVYERGPCAYSEAIVDETVDILNAGLPNVWRGFSFEAEEKKACFIPTFSAVAGGLTPGTTAFDSVIGDSRNKAHLETSASMDDRIRTVLENLFDSAPAPEPVPTGPPAPENFTATAYSRTAIGLDWSGVDGAARYELKRNGTLLYDSNGIGYWDADLEPDTSYVYTIVAYDGRGNASSPRSVIRSTNRD